MILRGVAKIVNRTFGVGSRRGGELRVINENQMTAYGDGN